MMSRAIGCGSLPMARTVPWSMGMSGVIGLGTGTLSSLVSKLGDNNFSYCCTSYFIGDGNFSTDAMRCTIAGSLAGLSGDRDTPMTIVTRWWSSTFKVV
uniref:Uncharacterized protein n=1 Tax=Triticum urartu TaxID=4572 RepID=A0A8R7R7X3_TRIUA